MPASALSYQRASPNRNSGLLETLLHVLNDVLPLHNTTIRASIAQQILQDLSLVGKLTDGYLARGVYRYHIDNASC